MTPNTGGIMRKISFIESIDSFDIPNIALVIFADRLFLATLCDPITITYNLYSVTYEEEKMLEYGDFFKRDLQKITSRPALKLKFSDEEILHHHDVMIPYWRKVL